MTDRRGFLRVLCGGGALTALATRSMLGKSPDNCDTPNGAGTNSPTSLKSSQPHINWPIEPLTITTGGGSETVWYYVQAPPY
jgi:hypothetical protein